MPQRELIVPAALLCLIALFTAFTASAAPRPPLIGAFAQYLLGALLTIYLLVVLVNGRGIIEALAVFILGNRKQGSANGKSLAVIIGYAIAVILLLVFLRSAGVFQTILGVFQTAANLTTAALHITQSQQVTPPSAASINPFAYYYTLIIFGTTVIVALTLFLGGVHKAYEWAREEHSPFKAEVARREALGVIQKTVMNLRLAGDYRDAILRCYRQMCEVLAEHGFNIALQETAREFSENISHKLELGSDAIKSLTFLFEEARYSDHQIDDSKRAVALSQLESLEQSLANTTSLGS
ncbi:MAG: DUF4129 domain-containing protein [Candidatus Bathyarchaeia archaeon]|jgi:hypothetical protein